MKKVMVKLRYPGPVNKTTSQLIRILILKRRANDVCLGNLEDLDILDRIFNNKAQIRWKTSKKRGRN